MSITESIKNILAEQVRGYRLLLDLLQRERACLVSINAMGVEELSKEKDTVVMRLKLLEEERIRLLGKFTKENDLSGDTNLQKIFEVTGDDSFHLLRLQLISLLQGIGEMNEFNRILIERSLHFARNATKFLGTLGSGSHPGNLGTIISREA